MFLNTANQRLTLLRESLQQLQKESNITVNNNNNNGDQLIKLPTATAPNLDKPKKTIILPNNNSITDEMEPMEIDCDQQEAETVNITLVRTDRNSLPIYLSLSEFKSSSVPKHKKDQQICI